MSHSDHRLSVPALHPLRMRHLKKPWVAILLVLLVLGATGTYFMPRNTPGGAADASLLATVKRGEFRMQVTTTGELRARQFVQISAPSEAERVGAYQMKIASIVPEGTVVKAGDVVAEIDKSPVATRLNETTLALTKAEAQLEQARLDSTLNLSKAREEIRNLELALEERKLARDQAKYEAPTVKRQAEIEYEKTDRQLIQARKDYKTKTEQAEAKMREMGADVDRQKSSLAMVNKVMEAFTIKAPSPGMVIYFKDWNGRKRTAGAQISPWEPTVATLPDLTQMESITYVNEIDVRRIAIGQTVTLTLDSDPNKKLQGTIRAVANVGEQRPNSDAKVFEVNVNVVDPDSTLRPGMTTGNAILVGSVPNALSVPLEAISTTDGISYVYKQVGATITKQQVAVGPANDDAIVIVQGVEENDQVLLSTPANADKLPVARLAGVPVAPGGDTAKAVQVPAKKG
jgi:RND family efflux transporter MFP subunit